MKLRALRYPRPLTPALSTGLIVSYVMMLCCGCRCDSDHSTSRNPPLRLVAIGAVRSVLLAEQEEIHAVLEAAGIKVSFDGSKMFDILVAEDQVSRAMELLRTNHLVLEKMVFLSSPRTNVAPYKW